MRKLTDREKTLLMLWHVHSYSICILDLAEVAFKEQNEKKRDKLIEKIMKFNEKIEHEYSITL